MPLVVSWVAGVCGKGLEWQALVWEEELEAVGQLVTDAHPSLPRRQKAPLLLPIRATVIVTNPAGLRP